MRDAKNNMRVVKNDFASTPFCEVWEISKIPARRLEDRLPFDPYAYNPAQAAHIIAYFALKTKEQAISIEKALNLVYLADRENIKHWHYPMLSEPRVALNNGPANGLTLEYTYGRDFNAEWSFIFKDTQEGASELSLNAGIVIKNLDLLSEADEMILDKVWGEFGAMDEAELSHWTTERNNVPEWKKPEEGEDNTIQLAEIMRVLGLKNPEKRAMEVDPHYSF
jgi:hypothetical protein